MKKLIIFCILTAAVLIAGWAHAQEEKKQSPPKDYGSEIVVDKLIATVKTTTISSGDIQTEKKILANNGGSILSMIRQMPITDAGTFYELLVREMIYQQALKLGFDQVEQEQIQKAVDNFGAGFTSDDQYLEFLRKIEYRDPKFDKQMIANLIWKYFKPISHRFKMILIAKQAIDKKIGLQIKLTLPTRFEENKTELETRYPGKSEEEIKAILGQELFATGLTEWIADIASRTDFRILDENYKNFLGWMKKLNDPATEK